MVDVLRIALERRDQLSQEVAELDRFVRMAEELLGQAAGSPEPPKIDPIQALFNSGEVLPPLRDDDARWASEPLRLIGS